MTEKTTQKPPLPQEKNKKPVDSGVINVEGFVKIFDPISKKVYVEKRA